MYAVDLLQWPLLADSCHLWKASHLRNRGAWPLVNKGTIIVIIESEEGGLLLHAVFPHLSAESLKLLIAALLLVTALSVRAETTSGRVVAVHDGDTLTVLIDRRQLKVRLADIDAPESRQPFGTRATQSLADLCFKKEARLETSGQDRYGRTIAGVICAGTDANAEQVRRGMAWVFDRYARRDSPLYAVQNEARASRRGLWSDPAPVPPWEWRQKQRK